MAKTLAEVRKDAMELPPQDRAVLSQVLDESLMSDEEVAIAAEWNEIAERRLDEVYAGTATLIPVEETVARARAALANARTTASRR